jgi:hypothetical protein
MVFGNLPADELERLQQTVKIDTIRDETFRDENRNESIILKFNTSQYEMDKESFYLRVTVEIKANGNLVYDQQMRQRKKIPNTEYIGQDRWEFHIPYGDYTMPRITAYVIEYGVMDDEKFLPVAVETSKAETPDEIIKRCSSRIEQNTQLKHAYIYLNDTGDNDDEEIESPMTTLTE